MKMLYNDVENLFKEFVNGNIKLSDKTMEKLLDLLDEKEREDLITSLIGNTICRFIRCVVGDM